MQIWLLWTCFQLILDVIFILLLKGGGHVFYRLQVNFQVALFTLCMLSNAAETIKLSYWKMIWNSTPPSEMGLDHNSSM